MDVGLTSEQLSLRDTVRDILRTECPPDAARQAMTDPERWRTLWKTVVDLGWTELAAPDANGDFGPVELAVVLEECGAAIAPIPLLSSIGLAAGVLRACGPTVEPVLADIAGGVVATLAVHSPGQRLPGLPGLPMTLQRGRLRGRAVAVPNLSRAELIVTLAKSDDGVVAAVVHCGDGVTTHRGESTDPAQPVADVDIDTEPLASAPLDSDSTGIESALTAPLIAAPPTWSAWRARPCTAPSNTRSRGVSSARRSAHSRGSNTRWPTTTSASNAPTASPTRRQPVSAIPIPHP